MKEFYVMNLDKKRIAIIAGGALFALGVSLMIGMSIGRGQSERAQKISADENQLQKLGLGPEPVGGLTDSKIVMASGPQPVPAQAAISVPGPANIAPEIPLRADPLVSGPPKSHKKSHRKQAVRKPAENAVALHKTTGKSKAIAKGTPEIKGKVDHSALRYTIQVAAFKRSSEAGGLVTKLKAEGIKAHTEKKGTYYLVTVGRTRNKSKLTKALARLKELEYDAYIRKLNPTGTTSET
jgi:cell division septation protein DedD